MRGLEGIIDGCFGDSIACGFCQIVRWLGEGVG